MLVPPNERLIALGLPGMAKAFEEQRSLPDLATLSFEERVAMTADREASERDTKRITAGLRFARPAPDRLRRGRRLSQAVRAGPRPARPPDRR